MAHLYDVPLPSGAAPCADGWAAWGGEFRVVYGHEHRIKDVTVQASAVQLPDGRLDTVDGPSRSGPGIHVDSRFDDVLTSSQARQLATAINAAADELDAWQRGQ